jgi:hypothetical protein
MDRTRAKFLPGPADRGLIDHLPLLVGHHTLPTRQRLAVGSNERGRRGSAWACPSVCVTQQLRSGLGAGLTSVGIRV